jgi:hypothetical protein
MPAIYSSQRSALYCTVHTDVVVGTVLVVPRKAEKGGHCKSLAALLPNYHVRRFSRKRFLLHMAFLNPPPCLKCFPPFYPGRPVSTRAELGRASFYRTRAQLHPT